MYSHPAEDRRCCLARTKAGHPCRQWAMWGDSERACYAPATLRIGGPGRNDDARHPRARARPTDGLIARAVVFAAGPTSRCGSTPFPPARTPSRKNGSSARAGVSESPGSAVTG
jgi:hypothetical protein